MLSSTVDRLRCPACGDSLVLHPNQRLAAGEAASSVPEIRSGRLACEDCEKNYPILAGVAVLIEDVGSYLVHHVKGISRLVPDSEIPKAFRRDYLRAKAEIDSEHIEEDLEAERVTALYLMNHYLTVGGADANDWWKPSVGEASPLIDELIRTYWNRGPLAQMTEWLISRSKKRAIGSVVELGCGVGGLALRLSPSVGSYLGVDSSFASIALARHLSLGLPYDREIRVPADLIAGSVSRVIRVPPPPPFDGKIDFIVGDIESLPLEPGAYDASVALNAIDMMDDPSRLPELQAQLVAPGGLVAQSCPYVWSEGVAARLRETVPADVKDSAGSVEWLYENAGLRIHERISHLPWLFYKHARQLEIYSVHLFLADKPEQ